MYYRYQQEVTAVDGRLQTLEHGLRTTHRTRFARTIEGKSKERGEVLQLKTWQIVEHTSLSGKTAPH